MERWTGTPEGTCNVLRMFRETHAISARSSSTTRQKDRRQEKPHSVRFFCFVVFRPHSLLDFLESRVMKRKSINHCVIRDRALRNGTLENPSQCEEFEIERRDLAQVVRILREVDVVFAFSSSTSISRKTKELT